MLSVPNLLGHSSAKLQKLANEVQEKSIEQMLFLGSSFEDLYKRIVHGKLAIIDRATNLGFVFELEDSQDAEGNIEVKYVATPHYFNERELIYPPND